MRKELSGILAKRAGQAVNPDLAYAGMVVHEVDQASGIARRARHLRALVGAGQAVLLVEQVLADVAGLGVLRRDLVAVGVGGEVELADRQA